MADRKVLTRPDGVIRNVAQSDKILAGGVKTTTAATDVSLEALGSGSNAKLIADLDALFTARGETTPLSGLGDEALHPSFVRRNILGALNMLRESYNAIIDDIIPANAVDEVVDSFTTLGDGSIEWYYFIASGTRLRGGKIMATWDESLGAVEILESHTPDLAPITVNFSVFHDGTNLMLMATETGGYEYEFFATRVSPDGKYVSVSGGFGVEGTVLVSAADTSAEYLSSKLVAGSNISLTVLNPGGVEQLSIAVTGLSAPIIVPGVGTLSSVRLDSNCLAGPYSFSVGQDSNVAGSHGVAFGKGNVVDVNAAYCVATGAYAKADNPAVRVHSGGVIGGNGLVGQMLEFPMSGYTNNADWTDLSLTGFGGTITYFQLGSQRAYLLTLSCVAKCGAGPSNGGAKSWIMHFMINNGGISGIPVAEVIEADSIANEGLWDLQVRVDTGYLYVSVKGFTGEVIHWQCSLRGSEVGTVPEG